MQPTFENVDPEMVIVLRAANPAERLEIFSGMWRSAREMLRRLLRAKHPDWTSDRTRTGGCPKVAQRPSHGAD